MPDSNETQSKPVVWHKALQNDELPEGQVKTVTVGIETLCLTHYDGQYAALDNRCPHQGGPLGEGSIENGLLRCPWHGWDYCPLTGNAPGFDDGVETFDVDVRDDGVYVAIQEEPPHVPPPASALPAPVRRICSLAYGTRTSIALQCWHFAGRSAHRCLAPGHFRKSTCKPRLEKLRNGSKPFCRPVSTRS